MVYTHSQPDPHQPRPALVLSDDVRNRLTDDVIVVPIFSTGRVGPTRVMLGSAAGGLRRGGFVYCEEITTIDRQFLHRGPLGPRLPSHVLEAVVRAVRRAVGEVLPEP